ncbi:unnamed protein product [Thlaspi arvense]|uniref:F-box associated beta-propeller type 1 domain-containing protein n=1 Tax=Thlaspi arvense TaxID=13288 RepID=A0AAU9SBK7_THLAR|nr:unnamed protein product [Thlaspi arvense]
MCYAWKDLTKNILKPTLDLIFSIMNLKTKSFGTSCTILSLVYGQLLMSLHTEEKKVAIIGDVGYFGLLDYPKKINIIGDGGYFRKLDVFLGEHGDQKYCRPHVCSYVPSLVQIKQPSGGECKEQSELEKRRYYEYMSRLFPHVMNQ